MCLFEITNGFIGESYVRLYAWAPNEEVALNAAAERFYNSDDYGKKYKWKSDLKVREIFNSETPAFITEPNDAGFPDNGAEYVPI